MEGIQAFQAGMLDMAERILTEWFCDHRDDADVSYILGLILWHRGQPDEALSRFLTATHKPNSHAAYLAACIFLGRGEFDEAKGWYRQAALIGHLDAKYQLGLLLHREERHQSLSANGERWLRAAASEGHPEALTFLAKLLAERNDVAGMLEVDRMFGAAVDVGSMAAHGLTPRLGQFEKELRGMASRGATEAMNLLGVLLERTDRSGEAAYWFERAACRGNELAAENLANIERSISDENGGDPGREDRVS
jgi:TPR repeat protein